MKFLKYAKNELINIYKRRCLIKWNVANNIFVFKQDEFMQLKKILGVEKYFQGVDDTIIVKHDNQYMISQAIMISGVTVSFISDETKCPTIFIDDNFDKLSKIAKKFILCHELAHVKYIYNKLYNGDYKRNFNDEVDADLLAATIFGKENAIKSLKECQELCGTLHSRKEIKKRIEMIKTA